MEILFACYRDHVANFSSLSLRFGSEILHVVLTNSWGETSFGGHPLPPSLANFFEHFFPAGVDGGQADRQACPDLGARSHLICLFDFLPIFKDCEH